MAVGEQGSIGQVLVYNTKTCEADRSFQSIEERAAAMAWSQDGDRLATTDAETIRIHEADGPVRQMKSGQRDVASVRLAGCATATAMAWSKEGELAVGTGNYSACGGISVMASDTGRVRWYWDAWRAVRSLRWNPAGNLLAAAIGGSKQGDAGLVIVLNAGQAEQCWQLASPANSVSWSPDGLRVAAAVGQFMSAEGHVNLFSISSAEQHRFCECLACGRSVAWSPDGERLAIAADNGIIRVVREGTSEEDFRWDIPSPAQTLEWAPGLYE